MDDRLMINVSQQWMRNRYVRYLTPLLLFMPLSVHASFIESTLGAAVVNDATATYYNPAALTQLKNAQLIPLGSISFLNSSFSGQITQQRTGFTQSGTTSSQSSYFLPAMYSGIPVTDKLSLGLAVVSNYISRDIDGYSILRYAQSSNSIQDIDLVPAIGFKVHDHVALGAGLNFSYANFLLEPITGAPSLNIPDSQSRNESSGSGIGGDAGILFTPSESTVIGFNYRTKISYRLSGKSVFEGNPVVVSNHYHFNYWTPARSVFSISQIVTPKWGFIATIQRINWSIFENVNVHGIATQVGSQGVIVDGTVPYHLRDTWLLTLGSNYRLTQAWVIRFAGSYNQSAGNNRYQITNGDSIVLGASMGYRISKYISVDGSYAHAFIEDEDIHIVSARNEINGVNKGFVNAFSLKAIFNI